MKTVIVSRHPGAVAWLRAKYPELALVPVLAEASPDDVRGAVVIGNVPMHLAALAYHVVAIEFSGSPPRGAEYGVAEMDAAGAQLSTYWVARAGWIHSSSATQKGVPVYIKDGTITVSGKVLKSRGLTP